VTATDAFASHVLEKLLFLAAFPKTKKEEKEEDDDDFAHFCTTWTLKVWSISNLNADTNNSVKIKV
jgi:hypothetical protein